MLIFFPTGTIGTTSQKLLHEAAVVLTLKVHHKGKKHTVSLLPKT